MKKVVAALSLFAILMSSHSFAKDVTVSLRIRNDKGEEKVINWENLTRIKKFIIAQGKRQTYCNMYNNNPFYSTKNYSFHLNPDTGQQNIDCQPDKSDFNDLTIHFSGDNDQYRNVRFTDKFVVTINVSWPEEDMNIRNIRRPVTAAIEEILKEMKEKEESSSDSPG